MIFHAFPGALGGGFLGVDIFLVISGFLITRMIVSEVGGGHFRLLAFYARRIRRIFPALIVVLAACLAFGWFLMLPDEYQRLGRHAAGAALFLSNIQFWSETGYFAKSAELTPLLHLWSLGVEEQFYLVWPCILLLASRSRRWLWATVAALGAASLALQFALTVSYPDAAFYFPLPRFWQFMVGAAAAITPEAMGARLRHAGLAPAAGLALILVGIAGVGNSEAVPAWWRLLPTVGAGLVILTGSGGWLMRFVLARKPAVWIGRISYPLYLWHWPLLSFLRMTTLGEASPWSRLAVVALSFPLAWLTCAFIEYGFRFGRYRRRAIPALCGGLCAVGLLGLLDNANAGFPGRFPFEIGKYLTSDYDWGQHARVATCWLQVTHAPDAFQPDCYTERRADRKNVLIWGGSHAGRLYAGLSLVYGDKMNIGQLTRDSCPPIVRVTYQACQESNEYVLRRIADNKPDLLIMFAVWNWYSADMTNSEWARNLLVTLHRLKDIGVKDVLVIGPAPQWEGGLPRVLARYWRSNATLRALPGFLKLGLLDLPFAVDRQMRTLVTPDLARYVSLIDMLCNNNGCRALSGDGPEALMTPDYGHLTTEGAEYVARRLPLFEP